ncbi:MAG: bifunctional lysylphosphatidylglycerol flippase/synthetase MprF [Candidatus Schekmanbacteria bacterium]|nr:bifunctional lysylphosphatidylglycerol flippase/synthetase MprF [Candidatus Schekmanbacteria bacterium]
MELNVRKNIARTVAPLAGIILFTAALFVIHGELQKYHYSEILKSFKELPGMIILSAIGLTAVSYFVLTFYDTLSFRYIRNSLPYPKISAASFIGYAFSNNIGLAALTGGSVRYRLYSGWGLTAIEIANIVAFNTITFWLGFLIVGGTVFLTEPIQLPPSIASLPFNSIKLLGLFFLSVVICYFLVCLIIRRAPIRIKEWDFPIPSVRFAIAQFAVSSLDWMIAGGTLYILLPSGTGMTFQKFLAIFMLAQIAGLVSQVPGGIGVFESIMLYFFTSYADASTVFGALMAYRAIYYLMPFAAAAFMLGAYELYQRKEEVKRFSGVMGNILPGFVPHLLAVATFVSGAVLLFSGAIPSVDWRLTWIKDLVPLPLLEISHFLGSIAGLLLLIIAWGIFHRLDAAYLITAVLLSAGVIFSLVKGFDYEEAILLTLVLAALIPCRRNFYRKTSLLRQRFTFAWTASIIVVLIASVWLLLFSHKHVEYSNELWWQFSLSGDAPRSLRAIAGVIGLAFFFGAASLFRSSKPLPELPEQEKMSSVRAIVKNAKNASANLALLGDKSFLFSESGRAFIMYAVEGNSWIALGDPVGDEEEKAELVWRFREKSDYFNAWPVFYQISDENLYLYIELGLTFYKLGEEGRVNLTEFSLEGKDFKGLRHTHNKLEKEGWSFEILGIENVIQIMPRFREISSSWLAEKNTREKRFSLGYFNESYIMEFPAVIVKKEEQVVAFANVFESAGKEELTIDLMRYDSNAPPGVMDYLFVSLMLWGKKEGYAWFNLGMAPLSGFNNRKLSPLWNRLGALIFVHGEHFYNFQGLRQYKEKFHPEWSPRYLASPGGLAFPRVLANIAALVSGGIKGVISK